MKGKIISQKVYEGVMDRAHRGGSMVRRLIVEEADNLAITLHGNQIFAFINFDPKSDYNVIAEVEVPDDLVKKALDFVSAKRELDSLKDRLVALLG